MSKLAIFLLTIVLLSNVETKVLAKKENPQRKLISWGQISGCLGTGACAAAVFTACVVEGVFTAEASCVAAGGVLAVAGCPDAVKSCVKHRRLENKPAKAV